MKLSGRLTPRIIFLPVAFISGFSALLYQIIWIKRFGHVFGLQVLTVSLVLAAFMAGLALGSYWFGRWSDRINPLRLFVMIELLLAVFAIFFNPVFNSFSRFYVSSSVLFNDNLFLVELIRVSASFLFLLIPSLLIGGTLPVLIKIIVERIKESGLRIGLIYASNNLGAFFGAFVTGFFLIRIFGIEASLKMGALLNIFNVILVLSALFRLPDYYAQPKLKSEDHEGALPVKPWLVKAVLVVFFLEGFTTLAYEVLWTRVFVEFSYDKSTYLYTVIIMAFIFGLALGGYLIAGFVDKMRYPVRLMSWIQYLIGILALIQLLAAIHILPVMMQARETETLWFRISGREYLFAFLFLILPVVLMGITYPLVARIMAVNLNTLGRNMGFVGLLDTFGSVFGSLIAGFILLPLLGIVPSFLLIALINILAGVFLYAGSFGWKKTLAWLPFLAFAVFLIVIIPLNARFKTKLGQKGEELVYYEEKACGTVSVHQYPLGYKALSINSVLFAYNTEDDLRSHSMLAFMPYFFHPDPSEVLVLGFGLGVTANCFDQPGIDRIHVAEICPPVVEASMEHFSSVNDNIAHNPKLNLILEDGRSWLLISGKKYDIITCDAIHPRFGNNLYTREYYELCKAHLTENGAICQWMPTNWLSEEEYKALLSTFIDVFPNASLWFVNRGVTLAVGSNGSHELDLNRLRKRMENDKVRDILQQADVHSPANLMAYYLMDGETIGVFTAKTGKNTDNKPFVEFSKEISMAPNLQVLKSFEQHEPDLNAILNRSPGKSLMREVHYYRSNILLGLQRDIEVLEFTEKELE